MFDILFVGIFTEMNSGSMAEIHKEIKFFCFKCKALLKVHLLSQKTKTAMYFHNITCHTASLLIMNTKYLTKQAGSKKGTFPRKMLAKMKNNEKMLSAFL